MVAATRWPMRYICCACSQPVTTDAVEKEFLALERGKAFQKRANIENIDSCTLDLGFYYRPLRPFAGS
jgi:hypothetical protein